MTQFQAQDPDYIAKLNAIFEHQGIMQTFGAKISQAEPGRLEMVLPMSAAITQHNGFAHAGAITTLMDSACGGAAYSLMAAGSGVLTIEFKASFLSPAAGDRFRMVGQVIKPGRSVSFTEAKAFAITGSDEKLIATMTATMMRVDGGLAAPTTAKP